MNFFVRPQKKVTLIAVRVSLLALILRICKWGLTDRSIWFDESGQYWISIGQSHFSRSLTPENDLFNVWQRNIDSNLDPGAFSFLFRIWINSFDGSLLALRALPAIFMLAFLTLIYIFSRRFTNSTLMQILVLLNLAFLFSTPMLMHFAFELRAYSYSLALSSLFIYITILNFRKPVKPGSDIIWVLVGILALMGRYSTIPVVLSCLTFTVFSRLSQDNSTQKKFQGRSLRNHLSSLSLLIFMTLEYFTITINQSNGTGKAPKYVEYLMLKDKSIEEVFRIVAGNFYSIPGMILLTSLILAFLLIITRKIDYADPSWQAWAYISLLCTSMQVLFSTLGLLPWYLEARWSIEIYALIGFSALFIQQNIRYVTFLSARVQRLILSLLVSTMLFSVTSNSINSLSNMNSKRDYNVNLMETVPTNLQEFDIILIDDGIYPDLRFYIERLREYSEFLSGWNEKKIVRFDFEARSNSEIMDLLNSLRGNRILLLTNHSWDKTKEARTYPIFKNNGFELYKKSESKGVLGWSSWIR